jgi:minimal PKS acyl carrier protein
VQLIILRELEDIMRKCAGEDESTQSLEQAPDLPFDELGYDSLALLETLSRIKRDYGVEISEDDFGEVKTPQELVDLVNRRLNAA